MNTLVKVFAAGAAGVFAADYIAPHIERVFKPDTDFAKKAVRAGTAGVATAGTYFALGLLGVGPAVKVG